MTPARVLTAAAVVVGGFALTACDDDGPDVAGAAPRQVPGLTAILEQYREDEIQGLISVKTTNASTSAVEVRDLRIVWPGMAPTEPYVRATRLAPGNRFDLRVHQGDAVCGDPPSADAAPPTEVAIALGRASIDGGAETAVAIPIDDEDAILPRVFARSCRDQRVRWAADVRFGDTWTPTTTDSGSPAVLGTVELGRHRSDEALTITEINGSVLLRIGAVAPADPVATLAPGEDATTVPIVIEQSGNCSAHALIESKKTFLIPIDVAIGDEESLADVITFDTPTRQLLNEMIDESCRIG